MTKILITGGAGYIGYLTYDFFKVFNHNYGLIGVLPILNP